jgi:hypothetical protein
MKITDHTWRPPNGSRPERYGPLLERPCAFMNCNRPMEAHARATYPNRLRKDTRAARRAAAGRCVA